MKKSSLCLVFGILAVWVLSAQTITSTSLVNGIPITITSSVEDETVTITVYKESYVIDIWQWADDPEGSAEELTEWLYEHLGILTLVPGGKPGEIAFSNRVRQIGTMGAGALERRSLGGLGYTLGDSPSLMGEAEEAEALAALGKKEIIATYGIPFNSYGSAPVQTGGNADLTIPLVVKVAVGPGGTGRVSDLNLTLGRYTIGNENVPDMGTVYQVGASWGVRFLQAYLPTTTIGGQFQVQVGSFGSGLSPYIGLCGGMPITSYRDIGDLHLAYTFGFDLDNQNLGSDAFGASYFQFGSPLGLSCLYVLSNRLALGANATGSLRLFDMAIFAYANQDQVDRNFEASFSPRLLALSGEVYLLFRPIRLFRLKAGCSVGAELGLEGLKIQPYLTLTF